MGWQTSRGFVLCKQKLYLLLSSTPSDNPILKSWKAVLSSKGGSPALVGVDGKIIKTFDEIEAEALALEPLFAKMEPKSIVAIQPGCDPRFPSLLLSLWRNDLIPLPLDLSLEGTQLTETLQHIGANTLIRLEPGRAPAPRPLSPSSPPALQDTHFLKLTSGTTGRARGIRFRAAQLLADCDAVCDTMGLRSDDLNYGVISWAHSYGFSNLITPLLCRGIPLVVTEDRLPRAILSGLQASGATVFPAVPVLYQNLAVIETVPLPNLRLCISAGAPMSAAVAEAFRITHGLKVHNFYGSSECGGIAYDATDAPTPEGFVGQPMKGVALHPCENGRIEVHSAAVADGYFPKPDESTLGKGRFIPGDLVQQTDSGLQITGRINDFINIGGRKLNPLDVEAVLREYPGIREVIVFGIPHASRGEEPVACVVGQTIAPADLRQFCRQKLPAWQCPRDFWFLDAIPLNERGKASRAALGADYTTRKTH